MRASQSSANPVPTGRVKTNLILLVSGVRAARTFGQGLQKVTKRNGLINAEARPQVEGDRYRACTA
jgi:hypothetical protein